MSADKNGPRRGRLAQAREDLAGLRLDGDGLEFTRSLLGDIEATVAQWEADDAECLATYGQHLPCSIAVVAEQMRVILAALAVHSGDHGRATGEAVLMGEWADYWYGPEGDAEGITVVGHPHGFFGLKCSEHGEFWSRDFSSWPMMARAVERHVKSQHDASEA